jgi:hypothetical protein
MAISQGIPSPLKAFLPVIQTKDEQIKQASNQISLGERLFLYRRLLIGIMYY